MLLPAGAGFIHDFRSTGLDGGTENKKPETTKARNGGGKKLSERDLRGTGEEAG